LDQLTY
jgi:putative transposase